MQEVTLHVLHNAVEELSRAGLPSKDLTSIIASNEPSERLGRDVYSIPNDPSLETPFSVINSFFDDAELVTEQGFCIQASASLSTSFAKPYYPNIDGVGRCRGLRPAMGYDDRDEWDYEFSFVGCEGVMKHDPVTEAFDERSFRTMFLRRLAVDIVGTRLESNSWIRVVPFRPLIPTEMSTVIYPENRYLESIVNSKFVLCPRGNGKSSIRLFETLACCNVPVYVGNCTTRFPLDWIIDWERVVVRISITEVLDGSYMSRLEDLSQWTTEMINKRRRYIFQVYHQFLAPERIQVFEALVLERCREMTSDRSVM